MLNYVWVFLLSVGYAVGIARGSTELVTKSLFDGIANAVTLCIGLAGAICFWSGVMEVAKQAGLLKIISKIVAPVMDLLFPDIPPGHPAKASIVMNLSANLLGLGNAATPFGIRAMEELNRLNRKKGTITKEMILFLVLNTGMLTLVPTTIIALRASLGSSNSSSVIPLIWVVSGGTMVIGIVFAKLLEALFMKRR